MNIPHILGIKFTNIPHICDIRNFKPTPIFAVFMSRTYFHPCDIKVKSLLPHLEYKFYKTSFAKSLT